MTAVGWFGILLGLLGFKFAMVRPTRQRVYVFAAAYVLHVAAAGYFYVYAQTAVTDSQGYYEDPLGFYAADGFGLATQLIYFIVHSLKGLVGGTFLDYFLLFQVVGFYGICLLMRIFEEIYLEMEAEQPLYVYLFLFLPGLHFWTSSIGKDGFLFFGVCLTLWAAMAVRRRYLWFAFGIFVMLIIRPHIALVAAASVAITLVFDRATRFRWRIVLMVAAVGGLVAAVATIQSTFAVDVTNADSVGDFLAGFERVTSDRYDAGNTAVYGSYPVRLFSLLFRPMFIDASGAMGYIASLENLVLLVVIATLLFRMRTTARLTRSVTFFRFALLLTIGIAAVLALLYYNIGLGLRQKTMFVPALLVMFVALRAVRAAGAAPLVAPAVLVPGAAVQ